MIIIPSVVLSKYRVAQLRVWTHTISSGSYKLSYDSRESLLETKRALTRTVWTPSNYIDRCRMSAECGEVFYSGRTRCGLCTSALEHGLRHNVRIYHP